MSNFFQRARESEQRARVRPGPGGQENGPEVANPVFVPDPAPGMGHVDPGAPVAPMPAAPELAPAPAPAAPGSR